MIILAVIALTVLSGCKTTIKTFERAKKHAPEVRKDAEYWFGNGKELPKNNEVVQHRNNYKSKPVDKNFLKEILGFGDVIAKKGRADAIAFSDGYLIVYEGWAPTGKAEIAPQPYKFKVTNKHKGFNKALVGNFFEKDCNSILLYNTKNFEHIFLRNNCQLSKRSQHKFKQPRDRYGEIIDFIDPRWKKSATDFAKAFSGNYLAHVADMDNNGRDDVVFLGVHNKRLAYTTLYATSQKRRSDNFMLGRSPKSHIKMGISILDGELNGHILRLGDVQGDRKPELVVYKPDSDVTLDIYNLSNNATFNFSHRKNFNVTSYRSREDGKDAFMFDHDSKGKDELVFYQGTSTYSLNIERGTIID